MTYDEAMNYAVLQRRELKQAAGDNLDKLYQLTNQRVRDDEKFAESLRIIGFRVVLDQQQTRH